MANYLIIGASSGIGKSLAKLLTDQGDNVYGTYNKNQIEGDEIHAIHLDVLDEDISLDTPVDHLDGIVYCPGSINLKPFARLKEASFIEDFRLQVTGAIRVIQHMLPKLKSLNELLSYCSQL